MTLKEDAGEQAQKEIVILSDISENKLKIIKKIVDIFFFHNLRVFFYNEEEKGFFEDGNHVLNIEDEFAFADNIINLIDVDMDVSLDISRITEMLKIKSIQNSLDNRITFSSKNSTKRVFKKYKKKTPVFEVLNSGRADDIFNNFIQPSRIFSKKDKLLSEKIDSIERMRKTWNDLNFEKNKYYIEEDIEGHDIYSFVYTVGNKVFCYISSKDCILSTEDSNEIIKDSKSFFRNVGLDKFCLISFKKHKKRGIFFLNIFVDLDILVDYKGIIIKDILNQEDKRLEDIFII